MFTDVNYRFTFIMSRRKRPEVVTDLEVAIKYVQTITGVPPLLLHSENAKGYLSEEIASVMVQNGTQIRTTIPHKPEENGISERINGTIMNE